MQKKRILSAVIAAALSATMTVPAFAAAPTFSDVPASHWAYTAIEKAAGAKMVGGIGNGKLRPMRLFWSRRDAAASGIAATGMPP